MGEVSEMMVEGILCEQCGVYITDNDVWFDRSGRLYRPLTDKEREEICIPRLCYDCGQSENKTIKKNRNKRKLK